MAVDAKFSRFVALKFLPQEVAKDPRALSRFALERDGLANKRVGGRRVPHILGRIKSTKTGPH
jgi:hypothetical protein